MDTLRTTEKMRTLRATDGYTEDHLKKRQWLSVLISVVFSVLVIVPAYAITNDTYYEDFDAREEDATIHGVDKWQVDQGDAGYAITQDTTTVSGTGNSLQITGDQTTVNVSRPEELGDLTPTWVEFYIQAGVGGETRDVPTGKAVALTFDHTGKVYAADGSSWTDTGKAFTTGQWYKVLLKLDYSSHLYDVYIFDANVPEPEFIPIKENLSFIDSSINSLNSFGFEGVYNAAETDDNTYIDDILVNFVKKLEIITAPQVITKGEVSQAMIVQLQNDNSETQTAWRDITLELRSSSSEGEFSLSSEAWQPMTQLTIPEDNFQAVFYYKDDKEGTPIISVSEYPDQGWDDALQEVNIVTEVSYFDVAVTTPQVAGEYFTITITAKDETGGVDENFNNRVEITPNYVSPATGASEITPDDAGGFEDGILELSVMYPDCGTIEIEVMDEEDPDKAGRSGEVLFVPAGFVLECRESQIVSKPFDLTVTAVNAEDNTTPNYEGPTELTAVNISPEDLEEAVISPAVISSDSFDSGVAELSASYNMWGTIKIEAYDSLHQTQTGLSEEISFVPAAINIEISEPSSTRDFFYVGESVNVTVSLLDEGEEIIPNYLGSIGVSATSGIDMESPYEFVEEDGGSHVFIITPGAAGLYFVNVEEDDAELAEQSQAIEVKKATIEVIDTEGPAGGSTEVIIVIRDEDGNIIDSENSLPLWVSLQEENPNGSALSSAILNPVIFHEGVSRIIVTNPDAEIVTIVPSSKYDFNIKTGTVKFGRVARKGVGTLLWREIKE